MEILTKVKTKVVIVVNDLGSYHVVSIWDCIAVLKGDQLLSRRKSTTEKQKQKVFDRWAARGFKPPKGLNYGDYATFPLKLLNGTTSPKNIKWAEQEIHKVLSKGLRKGFTL